MNGRGETTKKDRRTFSEWLKDIAGIEGDLKDTLKPAVGYTSGNIMLGDNLVLDEAPASVVAAHRGGREH